MEEDQEWIKELKPEQEDRVREFYKCNNVKFFPGIYNQEDFVDELDELEIDRNVRDVTVEFFDRGVDDWQELSHSLLETYPNLKYLELEQNFGDEDYSKTGLDVIKVTYAQHSLPENVEPIYKRSVDSGYDNWFTRTVYEIDSTIIILETPHRD